MKLTHTQIVEHLKNGFQVALHWSDDSDHVYDDVLSVGGEAYQLLYTYLEHNSYETLILFPDSSNGLVDKPMSVIKTGMSMVLQDVFHGWMEANWSARERMIGVALTMIFLDAKSQHFCKAYYKELGKRGAL
jgi:hypothetical protein